MEFLDMKNPLMETHYWKLMSQPLFLRTICLSPPPPKYTLFRMPPILKRL